MPRSTGTAGKGPLFTFVQYDTEHIYENVHTPDMSGGPEGSVACCCDFFQTRWARLHDEFCQIFTCTLFLLIYSTAWSVLIFLQLGTMFTWHCFRLLTGLFTQ